MTGPGLATGKIYGRQVSLELLGRVKDQLAKTGVVGRIERVDIAKTGAVEVQLLTNKGRKWVTPGDEHSIELNISDDCRIPYSACLHDRTPGAPFSILAYRPARRLVVREGRDAGSVVIKAYREGRGETAAEKFRLAAAAFANSPIIAPGSVGFSSLHDCIEMSFLEGERVQVVAHRAEDFKSLGYGIHDLQKLEANELLLSEFTRADELAVLDERVRRMGLVNGVVPHGWARLRQGLHRAAEQIPPAEPVTTHRDLHDGQLLLTSEGLALLDFDLMCRAEPELDAANFLAHLALRGLQRPDSTSEKDVHACGKKFLDGLDAYEREGFWERLRFYQATSFSRLALVYSLRPDWTFIVSGLVRLGHRCLDEFQH